MANTASGAVWMGGAAGDTTGEGPVDVSSSAANNRRPRTLPGAMGRAPTRQPIAHKKGTRANFLKASPPRPASKGQRDLALAELLASRDLRADVSEAALARTRSNRSGSEVITNADGLRGLDVSAIGPVRRPAGYKLASNNPGLFPVATRLGVHHVHYESLAEFSVLLHLSWAHSFDSLMTQPLRLEWRHDRVWIQHTPDILFTDDQGNYTVIDVHGPDQDPNWRVKALLTGEVCGRLGWSYFVMSRVHPQVVMNLEFLQMFRVVHTRNARLASAIESDLPPGASIAGVLRRDDVPRADVLAALWHLVWWRRLHVDLFAPIRSYTHLSRRPQPGWVAEPWITADEGGFLA